LSNSWSDPIQNIQSELIFSGIKKDLVNFLHKILKIDAPFSFQDSLVQTADELHA
jgi:hypothetical protein